MRFTNNVVFTLSRVDEIYIIYCTLICLITSVTNLIVELDRLQNLSLFHIITFLKKLFLKSLKKVITALLAHYNLI